MVQASFQIERLNNHHKRELFSCGIQALDDFLKNKASQYCKRNLCVTYVLLENGTSDVIGYYSLSSTSIPLDLLPEKISKKLPKHPVIPGTLIGRIGIDERHRNKNLGELLLFDALKKSLEHSNSIGSMAVTVDAINDIAISFYEKYGFIKLTDNKNKLLLPMKTINQLVLST